MRASPGGMDDRKRYYRNASWSRDSIERRIPLRHSTPGTFVPSGVVAGHTGGSGRGSIKSWQGHTKGGRRYSKVIIGVSLIIAVVGFILLRAFGR